MVQRPGAALANPRCAFRCLGLRFLQKRSENLERRHVAFLPWASTPSAYEIQAAGVLRACVRGRLSASRSAGVLRFRESTVRPGLSSASQGEGSALARSLVRSDGRPRSYPRCPAEHRPTRPLKILGAAERAGNWYLPMRTRAWIFLGNFQKGALENIRHFRRGEWEGTGQWAVWGTRSPTRREPEGAWGSRSHWGVCRGRKGTCDGGAREGTSLSPEGSACGSRKTRPHPPRFRQVQASLGATWRAPASRGGREGAWHHWHRPQSCRSRVDSRGPAQGPRPPLPVATTSNSLGPGGLRRHTRLPRRMDRGGPAPVTWSNRQRRLMSLLPDQMRNQKRKFPRRLREIKRFRGQL